MPVALDAILESSPDVCGGRLRIAGTRITVGQIAYLSNTGKTAMQIVAHSARLTLAQVHTALAYYHANREEIDRQLAEDGAEYDRLAITNREHGAEHVANVNA